MSKQNLFNIFILVFSIANLGYSIYMNHHWQLYAYNAMVNWHTEYMKHFARLYENDETFYNNLKDVDEKLGLPGIPKVSPIPLP